MILNSSNDSLEARTFREQLNCLLLDLYLRDEWNGSIEMPILFQWRKLDWPLQIQPMHYRCLRRQLASFHVFLQKKRKKKKKDEGLLKLPPILEWMSIYSTFATESSILIWTTDLGSCYQFTSSLVPALTSWHWGGENFEVTEFLELISHYLYSACICL